jgi:phage internal scaffolding protein
MIKGPFIRTPYNYNTDTVSALTGFSASEKTVVQQQFKDEVNLNVMVARFGINAVATQSAHMPTYGDFTGVSDYKSALDAIMAADASFMTLPPAVRERFANDPAALVDFCSDPANRSEAIELGLVPPPRKEEGFTPPEVVVETGEKS